MNKVMAQMMGDEYICEDEFGDEYPSSIPCDEEVCVAACTICGEQFDCDDSHFCDWITCGSCHETYIRSQGHTCQIVDNNNNDNNEGGGHGGSGQGGTIIGPGNNNNDNEDTPPEDNSQNGNEENFTDPCEMANALNNNKQLRDSISKYTNELMLGITTVEKGWIKDQDGNVYTATGNANSLTFSGSIISQIKGKEIHERFHTHPSASVIPSPTDILTMGKSFKKGNINPKTYNYGILCAYYMSVYHITSKENFASFADSIENNTAKFIATYNKIIQPCKPASTEEQLNKFMFLIDSLNIGLRVSFGRHEYRSINDKLDTLKNVTSIAPILRKDNTDINYENCN